jgi:methylmalonyl-CoA mutase cobalamin-binding subunit
MIKLMDILKEKRVDNTLVVFGGIILPDDVPRPKEIGVAPGSDVDSMVNFTKESTSQ